MLADKTQIARIIPHAGTMCLLDGVLECDAQHIRCVSRSHLDQDNPLRTEHGLPVLCGIEYAAQAMAVHGGMSGQVGDNPGNKPRAGYLVGVRDVQCKVPRLDTLAPKLMIEAEKLMGDDARVMYQFSLSSDGKIVLQGKATVVLDTDRVAA
jgi:predicted hotdog family 3-hydroxylacyl-ACP dehydratase